MNVATLVASPSLARALLVRWYITVPGIAFSLGLAAATYAVLPPSFGSTSTVVLIPAAQHGSNSLLTFDTGLSTSAEIIVAGMNDPQVATDMGVIVGQEKVAVVNGNAGSNGKIAESAGPFISVTTQSSSPARATALAGQATTMIAQKLTDLQTSVKVNKQQSINLSTVVSPTPGKVLWEMILRTVGLALLFGCALTVAAVCLVDRWARGRSSRNLLETEAQRVSVPTTPRPTNGARQGVDPFSRTDRLAASVTPELVSKPTRPRKKAPARR